ncbi:MAG: His/Gly/Thr/Pro-type tRNA ligase C-terminal domain-containing protein, partial [Marmoricola sp.]
RLCGGGDPAAPPSPPGPARRARVAAQDRARGDALAGRLRARGIACEVVATAQKFGKQIRYAERRGIPWVLFAGGDGTVEAKDIRSGEQSPIDPDTWSPPEADLRPRIARQDTAKP